jgi:hypothetical protein
MTTSCCQIYTQVNFKPQGGGHSQSQHDVSDCQEVPCRCVCFHGSTVVRQRLKVLIEKTYRFIDANDGGRCRRRARSRADRLDGHGPA